MNKELEEKIISIMNGEINQSSVDLLTINERKFLVENYFEDFFVWKFNQSIY